MKKLLISMLIVSAATLTMHASVQKAVKQVLPEQLYLDQNDEIQPISALLEFVETPEDEEFVNLLFVRSLGMSTGGNSYFEEDEVNLGSKFNPYDFEIDEELIGSGMDIPMAGEVNLGKRFDTRHRAYVDEAALDERLTPEKERAYIQELSDWEKLQEKRDAAMMKSLESDDDSWLFGKF